MPDLSYTSADLVMARLAAVSLTLMKLQCPVQLVVQPWIDAGGAVRETWQCSATRTNLNAIAFTTRQAMVVLFDGCRRNDTARDICYGYAYPPRLPPDGWGENTTYNRLAQNTLAALTGGPLQQGLTILLCGYSAGAAVAQIVASATASTAAGSQPVSAILLNSPRPADTQYRRLAPSCVMHRYHSVGDPIGHLPLWSTESNVAALLAESNIVSNCDRYSHFGFGVEIGADSSFDQLGVGVAPTAPANPSLSLFSWSIGMDDGDVIAHDIGELARRLANITVDPVTFGTRVWGTDLSLSSLPLGTPLPIPFDPGVPRNDRVQGFGGDQNQRAQAAALLPTTYLVPSGPAPRLPVKPYYAQKQYKQWWVYYLGVPLFHCVNGSREAKQRARAMNGVVTSFDNSDNRDRVNMIDSLDTALDQ